MEKARILCVSYDAVVSESRVSALNGAGYEVMGVTNIDRASAVLDSQEFNLVIIGHRFSKADKSRLIAQAEEERIPVLLVCGSYPESDLKVADRVYAIEGVEGMLKKVAGVISLKAA